MDFQTRGLLIRSIEAYSAADKARQLEMIRHVEDMLNRHDRAINAIAYGFAEHYVQAGKIFLRIYKKLLNHDNSSANKGKGVDRLLPV